MVSRRSNKNAKSLSFYQRMVAKLTASKEKKDALTGWSKASDDRSEIAFSDTTYFQKPEGKMELEILYRNNWAIFKAINVRANLLSFRGAKLVCKSDESKKVTNDFLKRMHPTRPMLALQNSFRNRSINADVFGNATDELVFTPTGTKDKPVPVSKAKDLQRFTPIHPINIDLQRVTNSDVIKFKNNVPVGWIFHRDPVVTYTGGTKIPLDRVAHLKYNTIGDEILGISTIEPIFKTAERLLKVEEGITQGILTHGNPLHDVIVGDESHPPTKKMIDAVATEVEGLNMKSEYVHPPWIRVGQIESFSLGKSPNYVQPFVTAIAAATSVPEFVLLGRGEGTNKATAQAMINFIHQAIEPLQQAQSMYFEEQILAPLMKLHNVEDVPMVEWNEILPRNPNDYANVIQVLTQAMIGGKHIITAEEAREMAGLGKNYSYKSQGSELAEKRAMPGIYLVEPHGGFIIDGSKKMIVKAKDFSDMVMKPMYLISGNQALGIIKLRPPKDMNVDEFKKHYKEHMITDKERKKWWPDTDTFYGYRFNVLEKFKEPKPYKVPSGVQTFIKEVKL